MPGSWIASTRMCHVIEFAAFKAKQSRDRIKFSKPKHLPRFGPTQPTYMLAQYLHSYCCIELEGVLR